MTDKKQSPIDLLAKLTAEEVAAELGKVDEAIAVLEKQRDALRIAAKFVDVRENGRKPREVKRKSAKSSPPPQSDDASVGEPSVKVRMERFLRKHGARSVSDIAHGIGCTPPPVYQAIQNNPDMFSRNSEGIVRLK